MKRILIIEDNADLAFGLRNSLEIASYEVVVANDGPTGLREARTVSPDLVILDLMLPGMDGYRVLRAIRESGSQVPVLILTARGEEADKVTGFRLGADDYVTKPFGVNELIARMRAIFRRAQAARATTAPETLALGDVMINFTTQTLTGRGHEHTLSFYEVELLRMLAERAGQPVGRDEILAKIWGLEGSSTNRTVDNFIVKLRKKIEKSPDKPQHILTVYGFGYRLAMS